MSSRKIKIISFNDDDVKTVPEMDWAGKENGELLHLAEKEFDIFITIDQNIIFQQPIRTRKIRLIILSLQSNRLAAVLPYLPDIKDTIKKIKPGQFIKVGR